MTALNRAAAVYIGDKAAQRIYLGAQLVWARATGPALPPVTAGLLWHTDAAIDFTTTGPIVPAIPMPRPEGPVYCAISLRSDDEGMILRIGSPDDYFHEQNTLQVDRSWGNFNFISAPGWPNISTLHDQPPPPSDHVWEFWLSSAGSGFVEHFRNGWFPDPLPNQNVIATSHLFVGYRYNDDMAMDRGAGSIRRMAIFDRIPTESERAQLVEWVSA